MALNRTYLIIVLFWIVRMSWIIHSICVWARIYSIIWRQLPPLTAIIHQQIASALQVRGEKWKVKSERTRRTRNFNGELQHFCSKLTVGWACFPRKISCPRQIITMINQPCRLHSSTFAYSSLPTMGAIQSTWLSIDERFPRREKEAINCVCVCVTLWVAVSWSLIG